MLIYYVDYPDYLISILPEFRLPISHFMALTGKNVNWKPRDKKLIYCEQKNGYLRIFDKEYIIGEKYKRKGDIFICEYVKAGEALLKSIKKLAFYTALLDVIPCELEIA